MTVHLPAWTIWIAAWVIFGAIFGILYREQAKRRPGARRSATAALFAGMLLGPPMFLLGIMALSARIIHERSGRK